MTKARLDHKNCLYHPYVFGVMVNQQLEIVNDDDTVHSVHVIPVKNAELNRGQPVKGLKFTHKFSTPEMPPIPFRCDVHPWEFAYCGVFPHPFFAITHEKGTFKLVGLAAGQYVIEAWHQKAGILDQQVTVTNGTEEIRFEFNLQPSGLLKTGSL